MFKTLSTVLFALICLPLFAQEKHIPKVSSTVQNMIDEIGLDMSELGPSCASLEDCAHMRYHEKTYRMKGSARAAFEELISRRPDELWTGASCFQMEYEPKSQDFLGKEDQLYPIEVGQVIFLELDVIKEMQIPVAFQIVKVDAKNLSLAFSYLKQNKSKGIQEAVFIQDGDEFKIVHKTRYQSDSKFRDKFLYGFFHTRFLNDFYDSFEKNIED